MNLSSKKAETQTLIDLLRTRAEISPEKQAFEFEGTTYTYDWLWQRLNAFAGALDSIAVGELVLIALPTGIDFFPAFFGVQRSGAIPVPLHPDSGTARLESIATQCGARKVVVPALRDDLDAGLEQIPADARGLPSSSYPEISAETTAYVQFTSGSTGEPKGVLIRHSDILTNIRQVIAGMTLSKDDVFVSWLPLYHDMGLVIMALAPMFLGARLVLLPTSFVNLRRWLATIAEVRGTFTASPDFGYRLALRFAPKSGDLDLSSLRVALNAAEPVRPETVTAFESAFGLKHVMTAGYGLAEATVGVSMTTPGQRIRVDREGFSSTGLPFPWIHIKIVRADGREAKTGLPGEVLVRSPANTQGYLGDLEATNALYWGEGYIRTGDIGYLDESGELFIIGRIKEMLKHAGRTVAPREVEAALDEHPDIRACAAVSADLGGLAGEQIIVFCELRKPGKTNEEDMHRLSVDLVNKIRGYLGLRPGALYLVRPRSIPQSANGKMQRLLLKQQYLDGTLRSGGRILYPDDQP